MQARVRASLTFVRGTYRRAVFLHGILRRAAHHRHSHGFVNLRCAWHSVSGSSRSESRHATLRSPPRLIRTP
jgi:hypothetical protein